MLALRLLILCGIILNFSFVSGAPKSETTIDLVHVFFRHGDRTPDKKDFYPTDPYKNYSFYPMGLGQLTNKGKLREYNLGKMLRKRYNNFLGEIYNPEIVSASSTDFARTKMSLMLVLAGLWPPSKLQQWNIALSWQPIPYNYKTASQDHLIQRPNSYCPRYLEELERLIGSEEVQQFIKANKELFKYVEKWTGKPMNIPINMFDVYQNLNAEDSLNLTLPEWARKIYPEPLHSIAGMQCKFENYNKILVRLNGGHSLKMVLENAKAKINEEQEIKDRKIILISGHENNVINILAAIDSFTAHVPIYGSAVMFELHRIKGYDKTHGIKVLHYDQTSQEAVVMKLPGCTELCPFDKFVELTARHIPGNYTAECLSEINLD